MPYDLTAPARLLFPVYTPMREEGLRVERMQLGYGDPVVTFSMFRHQDGRTEYQVSVPCDNAPHCHYCECGTTHYANLTEEQAWALRRMLEA